MKQPYIRAFNELKKLGAPVYEHADDHGNFSLDAEGEDGDYWASYYYEGSCTGVTPRLEAILAKHGLFAEWVNPGRLSIYLA